MHRANRCLGLRARIIDAITRVLQYGVAQVLQRDAVVLPTVSNTGRILDLRGMSPAVLVGLRRVQRVKGPLEQLVGVVEAGQRILSERVLTRVGPRLELIVQLGEELPDPRLAPAEPAWLRWRLGRLAVYVVRAVRCLGDAAGAGAKARVGTEEGLWAVDGDIHAVRVEVATPRAG
ncbi:hypothetical protein PG984_008095 [Apiospora sp. TS-2023a]